MTPKKTEPQRRLFRRRQILVPTWRGWLLMGLTALLLVRIFIRAAYPFLAVNDSKPQGLLVVEGWGPDYALAEAMHEFQSHPYERLIVTGGPLEFGAPLSEFRTYAELGAATLIKLGANTNTLQAVPAPPVRQDRTYTSAIALKNWLAKNGMRTDTINLVTVGPHARRSRLLFSKAFGKEVQVGIISIAGQDYDGKNWWTSSQGVRVVTGEIIAYVYARVFFRAPQGE